MGRYVVHIGEMRNAYNIFVRKHEGKTLFKRPMCRCEDNIKINCKKTGWEDRIGNGGRWFLTV